MRFLVFCVLAAALIGACGDVVKTDVQLARCTNGIDDEGPPDGVMDCDDPQCADITTCVPTTDERAGIVVEENEPCPEGFEGGETLIHRGLQPGTCEGCGCDVGTTTCSAKVWLYADQNACNSDVGLSGGTVLGFEIDNTCTTNPIYYSAPGGLRVDITATGTCASTGTPIPAAADWTATKKFCRVSLVGNGCAADHACVPKTETAVAQCALVDGPDACAGFGMTDTEWYTGVDDQRTCGACFCNAVGGDCNNVGEASPAAGCTATSTPSGTITPTGQQTLCCMPM
jgi:hypothetical protein